MTPRELDAALYGAFGHPGNAPMSRSELATLMKTYPDGAVDA